ncbi:MAG: hypothetical protein JNK04_05695 [Myxococcales bacterium]|nr:hypothetical protein [Myxococcales bacterium]
MSFYFLLAGELGLSSGRELTAPALVKMREDVLEGASGCRPATLVVSGEPHVSVVLHVAAERALSPLEPFESLPLDPRLEAVARAYAELVDRGGPRARFESLRESIIGALQDERFLLPYQPTPMPRAQRVAQTIGSALSLYFSRLDTAPTIGVVADLANISPRTADRFLKAFTETYGLPHEGLRDLARRWRLKLATLLLSNAALSVRRVAARVGYRNAEALANALAAEGLPPPSAYRRLGFDGMNS